MKTFKQYLLEENDIVPFAYKDLQPAKTDHRDHVMGQFFSFIKKTIPNLEGVDTGLLTHFHKNLDLMLGDDPTHFTELHKTLTTDDDGNPKKADLFDAMSTITRRAMESHLSELEKNKQYTEEKDDIATQSRTKLQDHILNMSKLALKTRKTGNAESLFDIEI
jgi:hypothetical protein